MQKKKYYFEIAILLTVVIITLTMVIMGLMATYSNYNMKITFFNFGRADAILIEIENTYVMIDTGEDTHSEQIIRYLNSQGITELEYLILTHPDRDHIGGASYIIDEITVNTLIEPTLERNSVYYKNLREAANRNNVKTIFLEEIKEFYINDIHFTVYPPLYSGYEESNNYSLIVSIQDGNNTFLFTGDAEAVRLNEYLEQATNTQHTFLKVPHHGVFNKNSIEFLEAVNPTYAVITSTTSRIVNRDTEVASWLKSNRTEIYITGNGKIRVFSNGEKIHIHQ